VEPTRGGLRLVSIVSASAAIVGTFVMGACGESRRPIGEECLRDSDCLSGVCAARACVSAPTLVTGASNPPGEEEPRIPADAGGPAEGRPTCGGSGEGAGSTPDGG
jgi:hypothetical protein